MRVEGNTIPKSVQVEVYLPKPGFVMVWLRENVKLIASTAMTDGTAIGLYEYDEYTFLEKERLNLKEEIEANIGDWLATGRELEIGNRASTLVEAQDENARLKAENAKYEAALSEIEAALGVGV